MITIIWLPVIATIALVMIHVFFGAIVLRRGIIFIDLALAQWAALGVIIGEWMHIEHPVSLFFMGIIFTCFAALLLMILQPSNTRMHVYEAIIGVLYVAGSTLSVAIISTQGLDYHLLTSMLSGHILFVSANEVMSAIVIYSLIACILWRYYNALNTQSSRWWTFAFYVLFGVVVTSSVKMVGLLLVFSYLVIPMLISYNFSNATKHQLFIGWGVGVCSSLCGFIVSLIYDIPPSYCIILIMTFTWLISQYWAYLTQKNP